MGEHQKTRNSYIELCRFVAALMIMLHHTRWLGNVEPLAPGAWVFVEFFFILSGYFSTRHFEHAALIEERDIALYIWRKYVGILPYAAVGILMDYIRMIITSEIAFYNLSRSLLELPLNLMFLMLSPFLHYDLDAPLWFLSGLFLALPIVMMLMLYVRKTYLYFLCWMLPLFMYAAMIWVNGSLQNWRAVWRVNGLFRACAGLMLGSCCYYLSSAWKGKAVDENYKKYGSFVEILLFVSIIVLSFVSDCVDYQMTIILFFLVSLTITFSGQELIQQHVPKAFNSLGKLSIPLFCLHSPTFHLVRYFCGNTVGGGIKVAIGVVMSFLLAIVTTELIEKKRIKAC